MENADEQAGKLAEAEAVLEGERRPPSLDLLRPDVTEPESVGKTRLAAITPGLMRVAECVSDYAKRQGDELDDEDLGMLVMFLRVRMAEVGHMVLWRQAKTPDVLFGQYMSWSFSVDVRDFKQMMASGAAAFQVLQEVHSVAESSGEGNPQKGQVQTGLQS